MQKAKTLRKLIDRREILVLPGVYDALSSRIAQYCGFHAVYMTGYGTAASYGYPDFGLLTMSEMIENVRRISDAVNIPLIADADTGYGGPTNVYRTVREYEKSGAQGIQLEDQVWPKRSGNLKKKQIIEEEEMLSKIKAALDARISSDTVLIIRTDALGTYGFEEALRRAVMYAEAGADVLFVEDLKNDDQIRKVPGLLSKPCIINTAQIRQEIYLNNLAEAGFKIALFPTVTMYGAIEGSLKMCEMLIKEGKQPSINDMPFDRTQLNKLTGLDIFQAIESQINFNKKLNRKVGV
jgi:2-methylisocitrate lyase-like PEP mutase family enzyme